MTLGKLLQEKKDAIVGRWLDGALAVYSEQSSKAFKKQKDPFANPVGHSLRVGTKVIFEALLEGVDLDQQDAEETRRCLHEIVKMRAVQQFSAAGAVGFVFLLKEAVRAELGKAARQQSLAGELVDIERRIDRVALVAFDIFAECREQVFELRANEIKRRVFWVMDKMNQGGSDPELARVDPGQERPRQ